MQIRPCPVSLSDSLWLKVADKKSKCKIESLGIYSAWEEYLWECEGQRTAPKCWRMWTEYLSNHFLQGSSRRKETSSLNIWTRISCGAIFRVAVCGRAVPSAKVESFNIGERWLKIHLSEKSRLSINDLGQWNAPLMKKQQLMHSRIWSRLSMWFCAVRTKV